SRHLRRNRRRQCHRDKKALLFMCSDDGQGMTLCCSIGVMRSSPELHTLRDNPSDAENKNPEHFGSGF
ncbi:hypothetical protein RYB70_21375, partial [Pseudomonas syringae pv. actinidiae]